MRNIVDNPVIPPELKAQVDPDNINFVSNDRLLEVMQRTTATPAQVAEATRINTEARLQALKIGFLVMAGLRRLRCFRRAGCPNTNPATYLPDRRRPPDAGSRNKRCPRHPSRPLRRTEEGIIESTMSTRGDSMMMGRQILLLAALAVAAFLSACQPETQSSAPEARPVRTVTVVKRDIGETATYTGRIEAENETRLSFRIGGRMVERAANVSDRVEPGQVVARLEPQNELNASRSAQAAVAAAQAQFNEAKANYGRQKFLLARDVASRVQYERAEQTQETARAQLDSAEAQLKIAQDQVGDTELKADAGGIVIATAAEPGEVVQAGQLIIRVAPKGGRDAVFDVPSQVLRSAPSESLVKVSLTDDPAVTTIGRVREVSPQADPVTRTFEVKVGLTDPPAAMRLGATVIGSVQLDSAPAIEIPATALTEFDGRPAVWVVDPSSLTVSLRNVDVLRHNPATVAISNGLDTGEIVVTAGAQALHPGQKTRLLGSAR
jgi:RND family efflux transporter MFP subunit